MMKQKQEIKFEVIKGEEMSKEDYEYILRTIARWIAEEIKSRPQQTNEKETGRDGPT